MQTYATVSVPGYEAIKTKHPLEGCMTKKSEVQPCKQPSKQPGETPPSPESHESPPPVYENGTNPTPKNTNPPQKHDNNPPPKHDTNPPPKHDANPPPIVDYDYQADIKGEPPAYTDHEPTDDDVTPAYRSIFSPSGLHVRRHESSINEWLGHNCLNQYLVSDPSGNLLGYIREQDAGTLKALFQRQLCPASRAYVIEFFDLHGVPVLMVSRAFSLFHSQVSVFLVVGDEKGQPQYKRVGFSRTKYHMFKRKYVLSTGTPYRPVEFGFVSAKPLGFTFFINNEDGEEVAQIRRRWLGLKKETFSYANEYDVDFQRLPMVQRAIVAGCMVLIDFDCFTEDSE